MDKLRCKPGDRAKVIKSQCAANIGLIVCVVRLYQPNEIVDGTSWAVNGDSWVVVALSRSLAGVFTKGRKIGNVEYCRSGVFDDVCLVPLDDNDDGLTIATAKGKPRARKQASMA